MSSISSESSFDETFRNLQSKRMLLRCKSMPEEDMQLSKQNKSLPLIHKNPRKISVSGPKIIKDVSNSNFVSKIPRIKVKPSK